MLRGLVGDPEWSYTISTVFDRVASIVQPVLDKGSTMLRGVDDLMAIAYWRAACVTHEIQGADAAARFLESHPAPSSIDISLVNSPAFKRLDDVSLELKNDHEAALATVWDQQIQDAVLTGLHPIFLEEIIATLRADLSTTAPKNVKTSDLQRPVTVINTSYCTGFTAASVIVRRIGTELGADVLHLRAHDMAHIIGTYLGQDVARAPSPISHLAYKAAENGGRSLSHSHDDSHDEDPAMPSYTRLIRDDKLRKDTKKSVMTMDEFLNGNSKTKSDDLWEDLKINSVLDELVHAADSEGSEKPPLLVHIDDYNAVNMDLEAGSAIIGKILKVIDGSWVDGRKIVLVGTCSSKGAPKAYLDSLREVSISERLINLQIDSALISWGETKLLRDIEEMDYVKENAINVTEVLMTMLRPNLEEAKTPRAGILGFETGPLDVETVRKSLPETWRSHVLPLTETYRIATTMIGLCGQDVFNKNALEKAISLIRGVDETRERLDTGRKDGQGQVVSPRGFLSLPRKKEKEEEHEEQLLTGLVNAKDIQTTFASIHAPKETIESIHMLTTLSLIRPEAFSYGVLATERIPGCLLYGPPGTGKTLLAKAVAKESGANMIEVSAATINNMYVGESEKTVRALFRLARKREPLVIFIDEADALLGARGPGRERSTGSREVLNQFLREWDGVDRTRAFILVATNRPFDLDEAVLRRLPRKLLIDLPREPDRAAILRIHLRDEQLAPGVDLADLARRTPLYSGSDLKNVCVAAAMAAVKEELVDPATGTLFSLSRSSSSSSSSNSGPGSISTRTGASSNQDSPRRQTDAEAPALKENEEGGRRRDELYDDRQKQQQQQQQQQEEGQQQQLQQQQQQQQQQEKQLKKRVLHPRHFDAALREIGASVSEDMQTLSAIRRFDERYGDSVMATGGAGRRRRRGMGFEVVPDPRDSDGARVRTAVFASPAPPAPSPAPASASASAAAGEDR